MTAQWIVLTSLLALACGTAKPPAPVRDPAAEKKLTETLKQRDELEKRYASADADFRVTCETKVGDCLIQMADRRADFLDNHTTDRCRQAANSDLEARCVAEQLPELGKAPEATTYYEFQSQCYQQLLACTAELDEERAERERVARARRRMKKLDSSPEGIELQTAIAYSDERIVYIRGTLPPHADGLCKESTDVSACESKTDEQLKRLDEELSKEDKDYDANRAKELYATARKTEASCRDPEFECLLGKLGDYGATNKTRRSLDQNLQILRERQSLINLIGQDAAKSCLDAGVSKYQAQIIQGYKQYAREPVMFFRWKLHTTFFKLHKTQVKCLGSAVAPKGASRLGG